MGFQLKLLGLAVFVLLTLSFCQAKNVTIKVIGSIHCTDCIRHEFSNSQASPGVDVFISCKSKKRERKTQGNSAIDKQGKFNVILSSDENSVQGCFAKLQTASSGGACPIHSAQTASVELLSTQQNATQTAYNKPTIIEFSPITCQSAFFWPFPNLTFFPNSPPPPEYAPPPSEALPPVQPPLPPVEDSIPPPAPASEPPHLPPSLPPPSPEIEIPPPTPAPAPAFQSPQNTPKPTIKNPSPPPLPIKEPLPPLLTPIPPPTPQFQHPIPPIPLKKHKKPHLIKTPIAPPPTPVLSAPPPSQPPSPLPKHENPTPPPFPIISTPPSEKKPRFIPRAPPVPQLPPTPQAPRKYFNAPKSKSKPPHSV